MRQTLGQRRARHAWSAVESATQQLSPKDLEDFQREAKRLPVRIMTSGLGHAVAFMIAKGGTARTYLGQSVAGWLLRERNHTNSANPKTLDGKALCEKICKEDSGFLRWATNEVLQYLQWLVRFSEAMTDGGKKQDADQDSLAT